MSTSWRVPVIDVAARAERNPDEHRVSVEISSTCRDAGFF
jgi:isopenicillin N synthase-like dioxygenase